MTAQHTPGPWKLLQGVRELKQPHNEAPHYEAVVVRDGVGPPWGHVCRLEFGYGSATDEANAHLIAAVPELLVGCKAMTIFFDGLQFDKDDRDHQALYDTAKICRSAIAKAQGGEQ